MTQANRQSAITEELNRAKKSRGAAGHLLSGGFLADAVSRLYYSALYHVKALLLTEGLEPKSHEGALRLFSLHFVKAGVLGSDASHMFARLMKYREEADYNPSYVFTEDDVKALQGEVDAFMQDVLRLIREAGFSV